MHTGLNEWSTRLSALADFEPPAAGFAGVLAARRARESHHSLRWPAALAAAVLMTAAGLGWWLQSAQREQVLAPFAADRGGLLVSDGIRAENARLEWLLATLPERHAMRGSTAFTVAEIEDRLALLDDRLSQVALEPNAPERAEGLWRERVDLMNSLVQVRYADAVGTY
ncbi:MAG: hypothetical protein WD929_09920 [Steroidobacteraceae bacterium]